MLEEESLQRAIHEPVRLLPYDPAWPELFDRERERLLILCPYAFSGIEHIGSTAVPLLSAKPIIDLMGGVESLEQADALLPILCAHGYTTSAEFNATLVDRRWLMRYHEGHRTHHLHLVIFESTTWHERLAFRNMLRENAELRSRYEELKARLARDFVADREAYTAMKTDFVAAVLQDNAWNSPKGTD